jgi:branched-chain amino acid transport system substrate-binding protein
MSLIQSIEVSMIRSCRAGVCAAVAAVVGVTGLLGCTEPPNGQTAPGAVTIGIIAARSGGDAAAGEDAVSGAQLAVDLVNESRPDVSMPLAPGAGLPHLAGARLALVAADTTGDPDQAADQADSLVEARGAAGLVVSGVSEVAVAVGSRSQRLGVPVVDARSTADFVTELGMDWYFRTAPTDSSLAEMMFALIQRQVAGSGPVRIGVLTEGRGQAAVAAADLRDRAARAGYAVPFEGDLAAGVTQLDTYVDELSARDCQLVVAVADTAVAASRAVEVAARLAPPLPVVGLGAGFDDLRPSARVPVLRTATWSAELALRSPLGQAVGERYAAQFGRPMTAHAANSFTATMVLASAIDAAGTTARPAIRGALRQVSVPATQMIMPWGGLRFDASGQNTLAAGVIEGWDSGYRVVYPPELATGPIVWTGS